MFNWEGCPIAQNPVQIVFTIKKARCSLHIMMPDERYVHPVFYFLKLVFFVAKVTYPNLGKRKIC